MKLIIFAAAALSLSFGVACAQSNDAGKTAGQQSPGTVGAMTKATSEVATTPGEVKAQQGDSAKMSPGTVGAAPGASTPSQRPDSGK